MDGACVVSVAPDHTACDDANACTAPDHCVGGQCTGDPIVCDDADACTTDACEPDTGCVFTPLNPPCGQACTNAESCDDNDACTVDSCVDARCTSVALVCDDNDPCTTNECHPQSGCTNTNNGTCPGPCATPAECDDGDPCTENLCGADGTCENPYNAQLCSALAHTKTLDGLGHPLGGVTVIDLTQPEASRTSDPNSGDVTLGFEQGDTIWRFEKDGHVTAWRRATLVQGEVLEIPPVWLTAWDNIPTSLNPTEGGVVSDFDGAVQIAFAATALSQETEARVVDLGPQGLPAFLPAGWSPLAALTLDIVPEPDAPGEASIDLAGPLTTDDIAAWVVFEPNGFAWRVLTRLTEAGTSVMVPIPGAGSYAVVVADQGATAPPPPEEGDVVQATTTPMPPADGLTATGSVSPTPQLLSSAGLPRPATGEVTLAHSEPMPSGLRLVASVHELVQRIDGTQNELPDVALSLTAYQRPANTTPYAPRALFPIQPRLAIPPLALRVARVEIEVGLAPTFPGVVVDGRGGALEAEGLTVTFAPGDLASAQAAHVAILAPPADAVLAFDLTMEGVVAGRRLDIAYTVGAADAHFVLARNRQIGAFSGWQPVERFASDSAGALSSMEPASGPRLPGVTGPGNYLLVPIAAAQGLVIGTVRDNNGLAAGVAIQVDGTRWLAISDSAGAYATLAPPGPVVARADDPISADQAIGFGSLADARSSIDIPLNLGPLGPSVIAVFPEDGSTGVNPVTPIRVVFSEPVDSASLLAGGLLLRDSTNAPLPGDLTLDLSGTLATFLPGAPLAYSTAYTIEVAAGVVDLDGFGVEGQRTFEFTTLLPPSGHTVAAQLISFAPGALNHPCLPYDPAAKPADFDPTGDSIGVPGFDASDLSVTCVVGTQGTADPNVPVLLVNETSGVTATVLSKANGSFKGFIAAATEDLLSAVFINQNGSRITSPLRRQLFDDGSVALYNGGGIIETASDHGTAQLIIEAGAIANRTKFTLRNFDASHVESINTEIPAHEQTALSALYIELEGDPLEEPADLAFPMTLEELVAAGMPPDSNPADMAFSLMAMTEVDGVIAYQIIDKLEYEEGALVTHSPPFPGMGPSSRPPSQHLLPSASVPGGFSYNNFTSWLVMPMFGQYKSSVVTGYVYRCVLVDGAANSDQECPALAVGLHEPDPRAQALRGAVVRAVRTEGTSGSPSDYLLGLYGRFTGGEVYSVSDARGKYAMYLPVENADFFLYATHPDFSFAAGAGAWMQDMTHIAPTLGLQRDIYFNVVTREPSGITCANVQHSYDRAYAQACSYPPSLSVTHSPTYPSPFVPPNPGDEPSSAQQKAKIEIVAHHGVELPTPVQIIEIASLAPLTAGDTVDPTDIHEMSMVSQATGTRHQVTYEYWSEKAARVTFRIEAKAAGKREELLYTVVFGGSPPGPDDSIPRVDDDDDTGPRITFATPPADSTGVAPGTPIVLRLSEPIQRQALTNGTRPRLIGGGGAKLATDVRLSTDARQLILTFQGLEPNRAYTLTLDASHGIYDLAGNEFDQQPTTTGDQPFILRFQTADIQAEQPVLLPDMDLGGGAIIHGIYAYVLERGATSAGDGDGAIAVYDLSDPADPQLASVCGVSYPRDLALIENYSFVLGPNDARTTARTRDLLAVVGGKVAPALADDEAVGGSSSQALWLFEICEGDVCDRTAPAGGSGSNPDAMFEVCGGPTGNVGGPAPSLRRIASTVLTSAPDGAVTKVVWSPPNLAYLETQAELQSIGILQLQTFIMATQADAAYWEAADTPNWPVRPDDWLIVLGHDENGDGDFVDAGDTLPKPARPMGADSGLGVAGKYDSIRVSESTQSIRDFHYDAAAGYLGVALSWGFKWVDAQGAPILNPDNPGQVLSTPDNVVHSSYRTLRSGRSPNLPWLAATFEFKDDNGFVAGAFEARRVFALFGQRFRLEANGEEELVDLAVVSLGQHGGDDALVLLNITDPSDPTLIAEIRAPADAPSKTFYSAQLGPDGILQVATLADVLLIDLRQAHVLHTDHTRPHPAIVGRIPNAGAGTFSRATSAAGYHLVAQGGENHLVRTPPRLRFVSFPPPLPSPENENPPACVPTGGMTAAEITAWQQELLALTLKPDELVGEETELRAALGRMFETTTLKPARYREVTNDNGTRVVLSSLAPANACLHYHVLVDAPGSAGATIDLGLESLDAHGVGRARLGIGFPPAQALSNGVMTALHQPPRPCDAPTTALKAWRLSNNKTSPFYNTYLSRPFALTYEPLGLGELSGLRNSIAISPSEAAQATPSPGTANLEREILWSGHALRAVFDASLEQQNNPVLGPYAASVDQAKRRVRPGTSRTAATLPADYVMGPNPAPLQGGGADVPGTSGSVSAHNGAVKHSAVDMALPGRRLPIVLKRAIQGQDLYHGPFGRGWDFNYNQRLLALAETLVGPAAALPLVVRATSNSNDDEIARGGDLLFFNGEGRTLVFTYAGETQPTAYGPDPLLAVLGWTQEKIAAYYLPPPGIFDLLIRFKTGQFARLTPEGTQYWYNVEGRLYRIVDRFDSNVIELVYNSRGELIRIEDADAFFLEFDYWRQDTTLPNSCSRPALNQYVAGTICRIRDHTGSDQRSVLFEYDAYVRLIHRDHPRVEFAHTTGFVTGRARSQYNWQTCETPSSDLVNSLGNFTGVVETTDAAVGAGHATPLFQATVGNQGRDVVQSVTQPDRGPVSVTLQHSNSAQALANATPGTAKTDVTGADGSHHAYTWNKRGQVTQAAYHGYGAAGSERDVDYAYYDNGLLRSMTFGRGNVLEYKYAGDTPAGCVDGEVPLRSKGNVCQIIKQPGTNECDPGNGTLTFQYHYEGDLALRYNQKSGIQNDFSGNNITITLEPEGRAAHRIVYAGGFDETFTYTNHGQLDTHTDTRNVAVTYGYTSQGFVATETVGSLPATTYRYLATADGFSEAGYLGLPTRIEYPKSTSAPIELVYNARKQEVTRRRGEWLVERSYDFRGRMVRRSTLVDSTAIGALQDQAKVERWTYLDSGFLTSHVQEGLPVASGSGGATSQDLTTIYKPDEALRLRKICYPGGEVRGHLYNHANELVQMTLRQGDACTPPGEDPTPLGGTALYTEDYGYNDNGLRSSVTKGGDAVTTLRYDGHDRLCDTEFPTGEHRRQTYFGNGEVATLVTESFDGTVVQDISRTVDALGRPATVTANRSVGTASPSVYRYLPGSRTIQIDNPRDATTTMVYDDAGRMVSVTTPMATETHTLMDDNGNILTSESVESGVTYQTTFTYNGLDQVTSHADEVGTLFAYTPRLDGRNREIHRFKAAGVPFITTYEHSPLGELVSVLRPTGVAFHNHFDDHRQIAHQGDATLRGRDLAYDDAFRPTRTTFRDGGWVESSQFDGRGMPERIELPNGGLVTMRHDLSGRLANRTAQFGNVERVETGKQGSDMVYDGMGNLTGYGYSQSLDGQLFSGTAEYAYDALGPLDWAMFDYGSTTYLVDYDYYDDGTRSHLTFAGVTLFEDRELAGRLKKVIKGGTTVVVENLTWAGVEVVETQDLGGVITVINAWDKRKRLVRRRYEADGKLLAEVRYRYDGLDNVLGRQFIHRQGRADFFRYDEDDRLLDADVGARPAIENAEEAFPFALHSGLEAVDSTNWAPGSRGYRGLYTLDGLDGVAGVEPLLTTNAPAVPFARGDITVPLDQSGIDANFLMVTTVATPAGPTYSRGIPDGLGNTTASELAIRVQNESEPRWPGEPTTFTYDGASQLVRAVRNDGVEVHYAYQHNGLLSQRRLVCPPALCTDTETVFLWDAKRLIAQYDNGVLQARYYYSHDLDIPVAADFRVGGNLEPHFFLTDAVGSVMALANAAGEVVERVSYDPWGQPEIEGQDTAAPRISEIRSTGDGILVVFSEPVRTPLSISSGTDFIEAVGELTGLQIIPVSPAPGVTGMWTYAEHATGVAFGTALRFVGGTFNGTYDLVVNAGSFTDEWGNPNPAETVSFTWGTTATFGPWDTAPQRRARSEVGNLFLFQGQFFDYDLGLYYMRKRFYDPTTALFLQRDPVAYDDSVNPYQAFRHNPIKNRDPDGTDSDPKETAIAVQQNREFVDTLANAERAAKYALDRAEEVGLKDHKVIKRLSKGLGKLAKPIAFFVKAQEAVESGQRVANAKNRREAAYQAIEEIGNQVKEAATFFCSKAREEAKAKMEERTVEGLGEYGGKKVSDKLDIELKVICDIIAESIDDTFEAFAVNATNLGLKSTRRTREMDCTSRANATGGGAAMRGDCIINSRKPDDTPIPEEHHSGDQQDADRVSRCLGSKDNALFRFWNCTLHNIDPDSYR